MMLSMTKIKPTHYDVYPVFTCPQCGCEWQQSIEETVFPAGILCHCGAKLRLDSIEAIEVNAVFSSDKKEPETTGADFSDDVVHGLVNMGYKKKKAKDLVDKYYKDGVSPEELIGDILRGEK
tara:strand:+ start:716 stop:1081 length:366 start_codon:yes stop_codon:yes gene_type:complete